jgi:glycerol-3-phosphate dehydrogenase
MESYDLLVIGGGIIGAGVARDAALRGLSVALFEKQDFGGATTSGSTRLIHGGLRYLEMLDFQLVRMDLREREILLHIAPHLVKPLEFVVPFYDRSLFHRTKMRIGMMLYDGLSYDRSLPGHGVLSTRQTLDREPQLRPQGLQGAVTYYDAQVNSPERLCLENLLDARDHGAVLRNYTEVVGSLRDSDGICGLRLRSTLDGAESEVKGKVIVNASGPWFDRVAVALAPHPRRIVRATKGIHVACRPRSQSAVVLFAADGRLFFVIPWLGYSWIGTTDTDYPGDPGEVRATREDVDYLIRSTAPFFPGLREDDVFWSNAGVRALVQKPGSESSVSRLHRIVDGAEQGAPRLVSIAGGKITGYRAIAQDAVNEVCRKLKSEAPCTTAVTPLPGAAGAGDNALGHLEPLYGGRAKDVLRLANDEPALREPLSPAYPDIAAQAVFAARSEQCMRLSDFLLRRTLLGFTADQGMQAVPAAASLLARELGWTSTRKDQEIGNYRAWVAGTRAYAGQNVGNPLVR